MKVSVKLTRLQFVGLYNAIDTAVAMRNVGAVNDSFIMNAHLENLNKLRGRMYGHLIAYQKKYTLRMDHNAVLALYYIFMFSTDFMKCIDLLDTVVLTRIFEAADSAMEIEVNCIKAAARS